MVRFDDVAGGATRRRLRRTHSNSNEEPQQCTYATSFLPVGCVVQRYNVGLAPANFRCPALDL